MKDTVPQPGKQDARQRRRVGVSPQKLEAIIAAAQRRGLSASAVTQHVDGSATVYFGEAGSLTAGKVPPGTGWEEV